MLKNSHWKYVTQTGWTVDLTNSINAVGFTQSHIVQCVLNNMEYWLVLGVLALGLLKELQIIIFISK
jgi:hypothetical protein